MTRLNDLCLRAEARLRMLSGRSNLAMYGCRWSVRSANALKSVRQMERAEPIMELLLREFSTQDVFLDVGANFGAYTIRAARLPASPRRIYAVEPSPGPYTALLENISLNGVGDTCAPLAVVIGRGDGFVTFAVDSLDPSTGTSHVSSPHEAAHRPTGALWKPLSVTTTVPCFSIDNLVESGTIEPPTVVKIDAEGYEGDIIAGMRRSASGVRVLALEIHPDRLQGAPSPDALLREIERLGFEEVATAGTGRQQHHLFRARTESSTPAE